MPDGDAAPAPAEKPKRTYKTRAPDIDKVIEAIDAGEYDDDFFKLRGAFERRLEHKQDQVIALVREAFGDDAKIIKTRTTIEDSAGAPTPEPGGASPEIITPPGGNPFLNKLKRQPEVPLATEAIVEGTLPGPYKVSPGDGNSYRVDTSTDAPEGMVMITDITGGHQVGITQEEWDSWPDEGGQTDAGTTTVIEQNEFERRGAIVGGLHPSDIGE